MFTPCKRRLLAVGTLLVVPFLAGCDEALDIVAASLNLAFAIVNAAT